MAAVVADSTDILPLYVQSLGRLDWKQKEVVDRIDHIAKDTVPELSTFKDRIPEDLKLIIDNHDTPLIGKLQDALQEIERKIKPHPKALEHMRGIVSEKTENYYPCSIVEMNFSGHKIDDPQNPPIVTDFDDKFSALYRYPSKASMEGDKPWTLKKLMERIEGVVDQPDWDEFMKDQVRLIDNLVNNFDVKAEIPLRINNNHLNAEYKGKNYLPCVIAKVNDGDQAGPHTMHLLIEYIEIPDTLKL